MKPVFVLGSLGISVLASIAFAATPVSTTRPATRATTRPAAKARTYESAERGLRFSVPDPWTRVECGLPGDMTQQAFFFQPDAKPAKQAVGDTKPTFAEPTDGPTIKVFITEPCEDQLRLERLVTDTRGMIKRTVDDRFIVEDRAIDVNGHPGWLFRWRHPITTPEALERAKKKHVEPPISGYFVRQKMIWTQNRTTCDLGLDAMDKQFDRIRPLVEAIPATFVEFAVPKRP